MGHSHLKSLQLEDYKDDNTSKVSDRTFTDVDDSTESRLEIHFPNLLKSLGEDHIPKNFVEKSSKTVLIQESHDIDIDTTLPQMSAMTSSLSEYESVKRGKLELNFTE